MLKSVTGKNGRGPRPDNIVPHIPRSVVTEAVKQLEGGGVENRDLIWALVGEHLVRIS